MTVQELIDILSDCNPNAEVRLAFQPEWPFEYAIGEVVSSQDFDLDEDEDEDEEDIEPVVYIGESKQLGYLSGVATRALGWGRDR